MSSSYKLLLIIALVLAASPVVGHAQELQVQPTPFTVLLDFPVLQNRYAPKQAFPIWLESVQVCHSDPNDSAPSADAPDAATQSKVPPHTTFRLRLRQMPGLNDSLLLRVFFDDRPDAHPVVTAWSETGEQLFSAPPLGAGLTLPASESMSIATKGVDYIEIDVPGDGSTVRKALLSTLKMNQVGTALDFAPAAPVNDPFGSATPATASANDIFLFGRVRATLEPGTVKLVPEGTMISGTGDGSAVTSDTNSASIVQFEFNLESEPLLALVTFDILDADPVAPVEATVNNQPLGPVALQLPDLADPGYAGLVRPFMKMRFHYAGWVRCQQVIPGSALHAGVNTFILQLPADAGPVAVRAVELQLKHEWKKLDYTVSPF